MRGEVGGAPCPCPPERVSEMPADGKPALSLVKAEKTKPHTADGAPWGPSPGNGAFGMPCVGSPLRRTAQGRAALTLHLGICWRPRPCPPRSPGSVPPAPSGSDGTGISPVWDRGRVCAPTPRSGGWGRMSEGDLSQFGVGVGAGGSGREGKAVPLWTTNISLRSTSVCAARWAHQQVSGILPTCWELEHFYFSSWFVSLWRAVISWFSCVKPSPVCFKLFRIMQNLKKRTKITEHPVAGWAHCALNTRPVHVGSILALPAGLVWWMQGLSLTGIFSYLGASWYFSGYRESVVMWLCDMTVKETEIDRWWRLPFSRNGW